MSNVLNILGTIFSIYFYTWLHPDLSANVRIGLHKFKVDCMVYLGSILWLFMSACVTAPKLTHRTNALVGNIGMAVCSIVVILNHYLLEIKWEWGGLMYITNIMVYVFCMGLALMGQNSRYYYDRRRIINLAIPVIANMAMSVIMLSFISDTGFADVVPCISFGVHTSLAIIAQVCGPRSKTWDFFHFLNRRRQ